MESGKWKIALLFPGQGAQYVGMGKLLAKEFPIANKTFEEADEVLGWKISELCFQGPQPDLIQTANSQPAILAASIAAWRVFRERFIDSVGADFKPAPTAAAGLSLGEYSALVAAESLAFEDALRVVRIRGEEMEKSARENPGTMASIIGLDQASMEQICQQADAEVANINSPEQIVISGTRQAVEQAIKLAKEKGAKRAIVLDVSGPFHSRWMVPAQDGLREALEKCAIHPPKISVIHNVTAAPSENPEQVRERLIAQLCHATQWVKTIQWMRQNGIQHFVELGPGKVLTGLLKRIDPSAIGHHIDTPEELREFGQ